MRKKLFIVTAACFLLLGGFMASRFVANRQFRIAGTSPKTSSFPNSSDKIEVFFNHKLGDNNKSQISLSGNAQIADVIFREKSIIVRFKTLPQNGTLNLQFKDIRSSSGESLNTSLVLNVKYVDFADLPQDQKDAQTKQSDSFEDRYSLVNNLPLETEFYSIDYKFPSSSETRMPVTITLKFDAELDPNSGRVTNQTRQEYTNNVRKYRNEAIDLLRSYGYTPEKYDLIFPEPELANEFANY